MSAGVLESGLIDNKSNAWGFDQVSECLNIIYFTDDLSIALGNYFTKNVLYTHVKGYREVPRSYCCTGNLAQLQGIASLRKPQVAANLMDFIIHEFAIHNCQR